MSRGNRQGTRVREGIRIRRKKRGFKGKESREDRRGRRRGGRKPKGQGEGDNN